ncbi:NAD-dependent epimerase/dehydratase [Thioalkalivibrio nitratireducens DSM 14787]|uniref:NAD-dependent epimerase/dehydratase n=1 Tax=Thioalkalivibrio nitratireducens (strain DSM 14787 / UNIQEM 213 / ALEN2) TaxID=1255043 RepID=L0DVD4_THIND|nr:NAD-dependent epimerase/dehydratase family protein [Thioalkalivibrio nitratireducens]AGA33564.1 NAD-dependent epimerase/dehydratase [Thioalkalivibrio nitratireducens DSM 14787]
MNTVLVTGAGGVVGHFLLPRLARAGLRVHALSRSPRSGQHVVWHRGDLSTAGWHRSLPRIDTAFHLAPVWLLPPMLPELERLGVRRLVAFSSTSRHTKADSRSAAERALARRLADAEFRIAREARFVEWTVLRPTLIYGAGLDHNVSGVARFIRRFGFFPVAGRAGGLRQPVHADDLARACIAILEPRPTGGRLIDLGGGEVLTYREMVRRVFDALGRRTRIVPVPPGMLRAAVATTARFGMSGHLDPALVDRMAQDMVFDLAPAKSLFGYAPRDFHPSAPDLGVDA